MSVAVRFRSVSRSFGPVRALESVDLDVPVGSVTVLLGPNGAGKTTTVRLVTGALRPDRGSIEVLGLHPSAPGHGREVRRRCGVVPPKPAFHDQLTGWENLVFASRVFGASLEAALDAAERFGIAHALDQEVAGYSTGMRTRLALARAVLHDPEVLLLDEPTAGLDPESSRAVLGLVEDLAERGRTIVLCTHLLHEAEGIADQVVLMDRGRVRAAGAPGELAARFMPRPAVVLDAEEPQRLRMLARWEGVVDVSWNGAFRVTLDRESRIPDLVAGLVAAGVRLTRVEPVRPTLEELYFAMQREAAS